MVFFNCLYFREREREIFHKWHISIVCQKFHDTLHIVSASANIMPALAERTLTYTDYRRLRSPLPLIPRPFVHRLTRFVSPSTPSPPRPFLPLSVAAHLSSSSLSFSYIRALVTLLSCESIRLPSVGEREMLIFHQSPLFFFTFLSLYLFLSPERDPSRKNRNWTIASHEIHRNNQCQCRSHGGYPDMVHWWEHRATIRTDVPSIDNRVYQW